MGKILRACLKLVTVERVARWFENDLVTALGSVSPQWVADYRYRAGQEGHEP